MNKSHFTALLIVSQVLVACSKPGPTAAVLEEPATLIVNADIVTMNEDQPTAESMAIRGGRVVAIGTEHDVRQAIGQYDRFFDLSGHTVVPGFIESHDHVYMASNTFLVEDISPFTTPTLAEALEKLSRVQPDEDGWIVAFGADQTLYEERLGPTRDLLDPIFPDTPAIVFHLSGHAAYMNSEALRISGLDESTPDPQGGFYEKDAENRLTGYLAGQPAFLPYKAYPNATLEAAVSGSQRNAMQGITTSSEFGIMNAFVLESLREAALDPRYATRIVGAYFSTAQDYGEMVPLLKNYETDLLRIPFVKTWTDGSLQGGTAHLRTGYYDPSMSGADGAQGTQEYFNEIVLDIYRRGLWPAIHANGDAAVDVALNAVSYAQAQVGPQVSRVVRPQIIHAQLTWPEQFERMHELGVQPTIFASHIYYWADLHYERTFGPDNIQQMSAMNDAYSAGLRPAMHSDAPVAPVDPLLNIWAAVNRTSSGGRVVGANQAITPHQALAAYTINAAYQFGMEPNAGSLEPGKYADFVVLERNPLKVDPEEIRDIRVLATVMDGRVTFSDTPEYDRVQPID